jgi:hypothetical protein
VAGVLKELQRHLQSHGNPVSCQTQPSFSLLRCAIYLFSFPHKLVIPHRPLSLHVAHHADGLRASWWVWPCRWAWCALPVRVEPSRLLCASRERRERRAGADREIPGEAHREQNACRVANAFEGMRVGQAVHVWNCSKTSRCSGPGAALVLLLFCLYFTTFAALSCTQAHRSSLSASLIVVLS